MLIRCLFMDFTATGVLMSLTYDQVRAVRWRDDALVQIFSATMLYGLAAGITEGGSFISRPKEHWFLIWIPITLLAATTWRLKKHGEI